MPVVCKSCDCEMDLMSHPWASDLSESARFCPLCGQSIICPECKKPYYECECEDMEE